MSDDLFAAMIDWHDRRFPGPHSIERTALKLGEEAGELQSAVLAHLTDGDDGKGQIAGELADVLAVLVVLASMFGIDLTEAGWDKLAVLEARLAARAAVPRPEEDRP